MLTNQDILWFHIAMDQLVLMGILQGTGNLLNIGTHEIKGNLAPSRVDRTQ